MFFCFCFFFFLLFNSAVVGSIFLQGLYPFSETNFQDFSRTQIDFSGTPNLTLNHLISKYFKISSPHMLYIQFL